jgi:tetratricopeptide (TPR) repeat protein
MPNDNESDTYSSLTKEGEELSESQVIELEAYLKKNPKDLDTRTKLLGYYFLKTHRNKAALNAKIQHALWVIKNHPESEIAGTPYCELNPTDGDAYFKAKQLWRTQVKKHKDNPAVLSNATNFNIVFDQDLAESLLKQIKDLEPHNPDWKERLAYLYGSKARYLEEDNEEKQNLRVAALKELEEAVRLRNSEEKLFHCLYQLPEAAFEAGEYEKTKVYIKQLLEIIPRFEGDKFASIVHYETKIVSSRLALKSGQTDEAIQLLLEAANIPDAAPVFPWGQSVGLLKELLQIGKQESVIQFLERSSGGWDKSDRGSLDYWIMEIKATGQSSFSNREF